MISVGKQKALNELQDLARYACNSYTRRKYIQTLNINEQYVRGVQWLNEVLNEDIQKHSMIPFTLNILKPAINQYLSLLSKSAKRVGFSPTTDLSYDQQQSEVLKYWAMNVQTQNQHTFYSQLKCRDTLIGGLGWSHFYYDNGKYYYDYVNPREIFGDPDDLSPRMDNQNFVVRSYYVHKYHLANKYPKFKDFFNSIIDDKQINPQDDTYQNSFTYSVGTTNRQYGDNRFYNDFLTTLDLDIQSGNWVRGKNIRVVEVYYKKNVKYYECVGLSKPDQDGVQNEIIFSTFYKEFAEQNAIGGKITKKQGTQIFKGIYTQDTLLEYGAIPEQVPNQKYLPIVPMVLQRDFMGVPYGIVDDLIDRQDLKNLNITSFMHYKDQKLIVAEDPTQDQHKNVAEWAKQSRKKDGGMFLAKNDHTQIINGSQNMQNDLALLQYIDTDWEKATGLHDEYSGMISRETSGLAIQQLTLNTLNAQNSLMLAYDHMIVSEGTIMLDTLKGTEDVNQLVRFYRLGKNEAMQLNSEIALLNFEVYPEAAPNFSSSVEEEKVLFNELCNSQNPGFFLNSPLFLKQKGFSDQASYELAAEWRRVQIDQQKIAMEAQLEMQQQQMQMQQQADQENEQVSQQNKEKGKSNGK